MSTLLLLGPLHNHLGRLAAAGNVVASPAANSLFSTSALHDGNPANPCLFSADQNPQRFTIDKNALANGGFEAGFPGSGADAWTAKFQGAGNSPVQEGTIVNGGTKAMRLVAATISSGNHSTGEKAIRVAPGERWNLQCYLRGDGTRTAQARAVLYPGPLYWTGSVWSSTPSSWATRAVNTYAVQNTVATIPAFSQLRQATCTLFLQGFLDVGSGSAGSAYVDDYSAWPSTMFVGLFGHNIRLASIDLRRDGSGLTGFSGAGTLVQAMTVYRRSFFYYVAAPVDDRWWRVEAAGLNSSGALTDVPAGGAIYVGELVFGQPLGLPMLPEPAVHVREREPQARVVVNGIASPRGQRYASEQTRLVDIDFRYAAPDPAQPTEFVAWRDAFRQGEAGAWPMVFVLNSADPESAMYCVIPPEHGYTWRHPRLRVSDRITLEELALPDFRA